MRYEKLLSPIKIGKYLIKQRTIVPCSTPHFMNGTENHPGEGLMSYYADMARNGAAIVCVGDAYSTYDIRMPDMADMLRYPLYDGNDPRLDNYMSQVAEVIRMNGALPCIALRVTEPKGYNVVGGELGWDGNKPKHFEELTPELMDWSIKDFVGRIKYFWSLGFKMVSIPMSYECSNPSRFLSASLNTRTDEYGGPIENRAKYPLDICRAVKKACPDMLVEIIISGEMVDQKGGHTGMTIDETCKLAKMAEGVVDILQIRCDTCMATHVTTFDDPKGYHQTIAYAEAIKKSGAKIVVAPLGGYRDPDELEQYLREGKCDMFAMCRAFLCDSEYIKKIREGRGEDVTPCIRCNKCHMINLRGPWLTVCSVNPEHGMQNRLDHIIRPVTEHRRVAVIGGGPAGMEAAVIAAKNGHTVTLFEKDDTLGGQLRHADYVSFKWPLRDFKDWLIRQLYASGAQVRLGTAATPETLRSAGYDVIIAAVGAVPTVLPIPGADGEGIFSAPEIYGRENELGQSVIIVGGAETGTETAIHLAELGKTVTILTRQQALASECDRVHYREHMIARLNRCRGLTVITEASTLSVSKSGVTYKDAAGEHTLKADSVIMASGMTALQDEALAFAGLAPDLRFAGDCAEVGSVQTAMRGGYSAASNL